MSDEMAQKLVDAIEIHAMATILAGCVGYGCAEGYIVNAIKEIREVLNETR